MDDLYKDLVLKSPLKLKKPIKTNDKDGKIKKSKKSKSSVESTVEEQKQQLKRAPVVIVSTLTKAEKSFLAKQEDIAKQRILERASKTHKQRVEEFNQHLDSLSEFHDCPKVSWTK